MNKDIIIELATSLKLKEKQILEVLKLLEEGSTVPFIARYRKEVTGNLDEDVIRTIEKEYSYQLNLSKRKDEVIRLIDEKKMLTDELKNEILSAAKLQIVEDLYLPFKEKRKTKATEAIKNGLEPLAEFLLTFPHAEKIILDEAKKYLNDVIKTEESALEGASFIIAERIADNAKYRDYIRKEVFTRGIFISKVKRNGADKDELGKFEMYYDFSQPVSKIPPFRILAANRGEKEKILNIKIDYLEDRALNFIEKKEIPTTSKYTYELFSTIIKDAFSRLIFPSIERETRNTLTEMAEEKSIEGFASNLDALVMQPPIKNKTILSIDPAYRTGCKLAVVDETSTLKYIDVIYPHAPKNDIKGATTKINNIIKKFDIDLIVGGNGTASRETETFVNKLLKDQKSTIKFNIVSEAGASVYSASKVAQNEFPDLSVEQRSAVSIARRVQDPMAELVKIDPKSIGVGQYQHDVNQKKLSESLDFVMIKNINRVGVDINTASAELLKYVSGLDKTIASNIVQYRTENGMFKSRKEILKVKRLGAKAYEQSAGFLKIIDGKEILDSTFIHPESYKIAEQILKEFNITKAEIGSSEIVELINSTDVAEIANKLEISDILVSDILKAFATPNLDIRDDMLVAEFDSSVQKIEDLKKGMKVQGQVRNLVDFGAFVDIGLKNDALIHVSQISDSFVTQVSDFLSINDVKEFTVLEIDEQKGRIQLSLKEK